MGYESPAMPDSTMKTKRQGEGGFSILEAAIASVILGVVMVSVLAVASHCFRYLGDLRRTARSSQVLQQRMEDIRLMSWSQLQVVPSTFRDPNDTTGLYR